MRILILEDEPLVAITLKFLIAAAGHVVAGPVTTCEEAMEMANEHRPDVLFTNINLGFGTNGVACSRAFLNLNIPAVFVTGSRDEAFAARDVAIGYLCEPCDPERVGAAVSVVARVISGETAGPEVPGFVLFAEGVEKFRERLAGT